MSREVGGAGALGDDGCHFARMVVCNVGDFDGCTVSRNMKVDKVREVVKGGWENSLRRVLGCSLALVTDPAKAPSREKCGRRSKVQIRSASAQGRSIRIGLGQLHSART